MQPLTDPNELIDWDEPVPVVRARLRLYVRGCLVAIALGLVVVFGIAVCLDPYRGGKVWTDETHTQMGLPPCTFKVVTHVPCPSCGMTTAFALLVRGDIYNSMRANFAGTALAIMCLLYVPWALVCAVRGKLLWVVSLENTFVKLLVFFLALMLVRWVLLLILHVVMPS